MKTVDKLFGVEETGIVDDIARILDIDVFEYDRRAYKDKTIKQ